MMKIEIAGFLIIFLTVVVCCALPTGAQQKPDMLYLIQVKNKYGYIDRTGKVIVPPQFEKAGEFSEGLAWVYQNERFGFIDMTGKFAIPLELGGANDFSDGLAAVSISDAKTDSWKTG